MTTPIALSVNGRRHVVEVEPDALLVDVVREQLRLTGTKKGCATGDCGTCSVIIDGRLVASCLVLALAAEDRSIMTVEGLEVDGRLDPIQQQFLDQHAVQCGFCTPGLLIATKALLDETPRPTEEQIRRGISGNLCRCTGYQKVVEAIAAAAAAKTEAADG